jgi:hypothetical protein
MGAYMTVGQAFHLSGDAGVYLLALAVAKLGTMIPSSPGYVGTFDALVARSAGGLLGGGRASAGLRACPAPGDLAAADSDRFFSFWRDNLSLSRLTREWVGAQPDRLRA